MAEEFESIDDLELTFRHGERNFSLSCDDKMIKELLKKIRTEEGIDSKEYPRRIFMRQIHEDELIGEHEEGVAAFLLDHESEWELSGDDGEITDIEITF
jgi:hypothetical protein